MFKWLFIFWKNYTDSASTKFKINLWSYINAPQFKIKISNYIFLFIVNLNNLKLKCLKIFYKNFSFELVYYKIIYLYLFILFFLLIV